MSKEKTPTTPAVRLLEKEGVAFTTHQYRYVEKGGTANAARQLGFDEHQIVKTGVASSSAWPRGTPPAC